MTGSYIQHYGRPNRWSLCDRAGWVRDNSTLEIRRVTCRHCLKRMKRWKH